MTYIRSDFKAQAFLNFLEKNGIGDEDFRIGILTQLSRLSRCTGSEKGFYLSVVQGSKPTNQIQVMLLTQLSSVYDESVAAIERLQSARSREEIDSCVNALTKLMPCLCFSMRLIKGSARATKQTSPSKTFPSVTVVRRSSATSRTTDKAVILPQNCRWP